MRNNIKLLRGITNPIKQLKEKGDRLLDFFLDGKLSESLYNIKKGETDAEVIELEKTSEKYTTIGEEVKETVESIMDIAANASLLMKTVIPKQKRELLGLILFDCTLEGQSLKYTIQKPFDVLLNSPIIKNGWLCL